MSFICEESVIQTMTNLIILEFRVFLFITYKQPAWSPEPLLRDVPYLPGRQGSELVPDPQEPRGSQLPGRGTTLAPHSTQDKRCWLDLSFTFLTNPSRNAAKGRTEHSSFLFCGGGRCIFTHPALRTDRSTVWVSLWEPPRPPTRPTFTKFVCCFLLDFQPEGRTGGRGKGHRCRALRWLLEWQRQWKGTASVCRG